MNDTSRARLIESLARDAQPVLRPGRVGTRVAAWLALLALGVTAGLWVSQPFAVFRGTALVTSPQFLLESLCGVAAILGLAMAAFRSAIPAPPSRRALLLPLIPLVAWTLMLLFGLVQPVFEPTMAGKRTHCVLEVLGLGLVGLGLGGVAVRRLWPLYRRHTGLWLGLAAGSVPALAMQFVCMHEATHNLAFHFAPVLVVGALGSIAGAWWLPRR